VPLLPDVTLGAEEELFLVDPATLQPADGAPLLLPGGDTPFLKRELFECIVELTTPVLHSASEIAETLAGARARMAAAAWAHGLRLLACGAWPITVDVRPRVTDTPHYRDVAARLGGRLYGQLVCGLHVHVGLGSLERTRNALEGVIPWLPAVLAVSANSALGRGDEGSLLSVRSARLAELDPRLLPAPADGRNATGGGAEPGWWDARLNERWQTLEVRVPDQPTDVRRSGHLAALVQALAVTADQTTNPPADRTTYVHRRRDAARGRADVGALARHVEPVARRLGTWAAIRKLLESETEGERQLRLRQARGRSELLRALLDRSTQVDLAGS
jgi:carboxylate-amine ligase